MQLNIITCVQFFCSDFLEKVIKTDDSEGKCSLENCKVNASEMNALQAKNRPFVIMDVAAVIPYALWGLCIAVQLKTGGRKIQKTKARKQTLKIDESRHDLAFSFLCYYFISFWSFCSLLLCFHKQKEEMVCYFLLLGLQTPLVNGNKLKENENEKQETRRNRTTTMYWIAHEPKTK